MKHCIQILIFLLFGLIMLAKPLLGSNIETSVEIFGLNPEKLDPKGDFIRIICSQFDGKAKCFVDNNEHEQIQVFGDVVGLNPEILKHEGVSFSMFCFFGYDKRVKCAEKHMLQDQAKTSADLIGIHREMLHDRPKGELYPVMCFHGYEGGVKCNVEKMVNENAITSADVIGINPAILDHDGISCSMLCFLGYHGKAKCFALNNKMLQEQDDNKKDDDNEEITVNKDSRFSGGWLSTGDNYDDDGK